MVHFHVEGPFYSCKNVPSQRTYIKSTTVYVPSSELGLSHPAPTLCVLFTQKEKSEESVDNNIYKSCRE